ncbi:SDR family oxidoreductase [Fodinibius salsisoli]|uniref:SDR family oxidoreductase n=1 Tax=Fodinibius salsisoli TaxID=2820877 RepID=A0ABT3PKF6_9BACT|nr:SDR family oxidoreductase [Fodinibius salsisoli]MCW9706345.1 SDR family oxidoreductase [Fodinibius salsisoli]
MDISIVGGHGSIAMLLHPILTEEGHQVRGLIRKEEQAEDLRKAGAEPVICDVEKQDNIAEAVGEADLVIFAAGAGPGSGAARKWTVDRDGAIKLIDAAKTNGINRYVMISAMGTTGEISHENEVFETYLKAKAEADDALRNSGLDYTIVKPGRLTDEEATGRVRLAPGVPRGEIPRADVATVLAEVINNPDTSGLEFEVTSGEQPITEAVREIAS